MNEPGWAVARRERLATISAGRTALKANDDFLSGKIDHVKAPKVHATQLPPEELIARQLNTNFRIMEQIRGRVDAVVDDPEVAESLKPYYSYGCKRPTFHDQYLPSFNRPNVHLINTAPAGVSKINETGVVHNGIEYPVDALIYATGFQWMGTSTFNMVTGPGGRTLNSKWKEEGTKTFLGMHSAGFPNLLIMTGPQGGGGQFNFTRVCEMHATYVTWMLTEMRDRGVETVDVKKEFEDEYAHHCREMDLLSQPLRDCYSYYNGDGSAEPGSLAYYGGGDRWHERRKAAQASLDPYIFKMQ